MTEDIQSQELDTELNQPAPLGAEAALESICTQNREFYSDRRGIGALKDLQQTFPNPWLYVAELLQNAVDEGATRIEVTITSDGSVVFEHDGKVFSPEDVEALCSRGVSAKGANTVGFMGIGFKSVFRSFEVVQIASGPWRFALAVPVRKGEEYGDQQRDWLGAVLPHWDPSVPAPSAGMKCLFVLSNRLPDLPPPAQDLERVLGENETLLALLAWQGVKELAWNGKTWILERHESWIGETGDLRVVLESVDGEGNSCRRWILFSKHYQPSRQAIARFLEHRQLFPSPQDKERVYGEASRKRKVAVFCEVDELDNPIPMDRGSAFALLPTGVTFPMGLHIQADWLLVVTRREIMQIEGNAWHEEILTQLPFLFRYYLEWLVAPGRNDPGAGWHRGYDALPSPPSPNMVSDEWFGAEQFLNVLSQELADLAFLPKPRSKDGSVTFLTPNKARFLPKPFAQQFDTKSHPDVLFGDRIIESHLLGARATQCLQRLDLFQELTAGDVVEMWNAAVVTRWLDLFPEEPRYKMLLRILQALVELDEVEEWRTAALVCLPTASGGWAHRRALSRYPADWNILAQEDDIRHAFEPFVGIPEKLVAWEIEGTLQQTRSPARSYLDSVSQPKLEEVVNKWWDHMPQIPATEHVGLIVRFTTWVLEKQPQRRNLVTKLLCVEEGGNDLQLRPTKETVLSDPYAGGFRRVFFTLRPAVAPLYESQGSTSSRADWRAFFEKLDPAPAGKFLLKLKGQLASSGELTKLVGDNYRPPDRRSGWLVLDWRGFKIQSNRYTVVDASLPLALADLLQGSVNREQFAAITRWLGESPTYLREYGSVQLVYIPYMCSFIQTSPLPKQAEWVVTLGNSAWIYTKAGEGPFRPSDVLSSEDPVRPDAPVADLLPELVDALRQCGLQFGRALPDAPAIERLRIQGPSASEEQLLDFLEAAISEADDDNKKDLLRTTLRERALFQMPPGRPAIDGAMRVSHNRLIRNERGRSVLGNWLLPIDSLPEGSIGRRLLELVDSFHSVPKTTSPTQVLDFLSWVWSNTPDADLVRRLLSRAYGYVKEDLEADPSLVPQWQDILPRARVFVQNRKRWVPIAGTDALFLDDVNDSSLAGVVSSLELATGGHFGESPTDQIQVANLLGIRLLSARFRVSVEPKGPQTVPDHWQRGFGAIQDWLRREMGETDNTDTELQTRGIPQNNLRLSRWQMLRSVVLDYGTPVQVNEVKAAPWKDGTIAVNCMPDDFAEQLCKVLFNQWGLRLRRDLVELIPRVAIQLTKINDADVVAAWQSGKQLTPIEQPTSPTENQSSGESTPLENGVAPEESEKPATAAGGQPAPSIPPAAVTPPEETGQVIAAGGSYTEDTREARLRALIEKKKELEQKIRNALATDVSPLDQLENEKERLGEFQSDDPYRQATLKFESDNQRYALAKGVTQAGHDIDSYTHPEGHPDRKLVRRIEVKGRSTRWDLDEIVEMSDIQFRDSLEMAVPEGVELDSDFDYWLYVVERQEDGQLGVLPIRNAAKRAARFALKGGSWRHQADDVVRPGRTGSGA